MKKLIAFMSVIIFTLTLSLGSFSKPAMALTENLAENKRVIASSELTLAGMSYAKEHATDNDFDTSWYADNSQEEAWIEVDLGQASQINQLKIYWGIYDYSKDFSFQYSLEAAPGEDDWHSLEVSNLTNTMTRAFYITEADTNQEIRWLRIFMKAKNDWSYEIFEIQAYGSTLGTGEEGQDGEKEQESSDWTVDYSGNHAYLPYEWFSEAVTDGYIEDKLQELEESNIKYLLCDVGLYKVVASGRKCTISNTISYGQLGKWIAAARCRGMKVSATINVALSSNFYKIASGKTTYGDRVRNQILSLVNTLAIRGVSYKGKYYTVDGIHLDIEPFRQEHQTYYYNLVKAVNKALPEGKILSAFTPAKNGLWSNIYLISIVNELDMINPGIYDTNGPDFWGTFEDGVTQSRGEYIALVKESCLWYSQAIAESENKDCILSPTVPIYEDKGYKDEGTPQGFPEESSKYIYYHLNYNNSTGEDLETLENSVLGIKGAISEGAHVYSAGIFYWPSIIGENASYQLAINSHYNYEKDWRDWQSLWLENVD